MLETDQTAGLQRLEREILRLSYLIVRHRVVILHSCIYRIVAYHIISYI